MAKKNKSGVGKFFLGALLGGVAGAIAGKFIKINQDGGEEIDDKVTKSVKKAEKKVAKVAKKEK